MNDWASWSRDCRCGYADERYRTKSVRVQPLGKGLKCPNKTRDTHTCPVIACDCDAMGKPDHYGIRCDKRNCTLHEWSGWSNTCGCPTGRCYSSSRCPTLTPQKTRTRGVKHHAEGGGNACSTERSDTDYCGHRCVNRCMGIPGSGVYCRYKQE